jgi:Na+/melibiose symporter-like transporter
MKRIQLIEWGLIAVALIFGYKFFEQLFSIVIQIFIGLRGGFDMEGMVEGILGMLLVSGLYLLAFILLLRKSRTIAISVNGNAPDETLPINIGKKALLFVILIGLCCFTILSNISRIVLYLVEYFKREVDSRPSWDVIDQSITGKFDFMVSVVQTIFSLIGIYFARDITNWFIRKDETDELLIETKPEASHDVH